MKKLKIVRAKVDEESCPSLEYDGNDRKYWFKVIDENPSPTLEEISWFCDMNAESRNAHDFMQCHILLAGVLLKMTGRLLATKIMRGIAERGGLDGMSGVCGFEKYDTFKEFGVESGQDYGPDFVLKS